MSPRWFLLFWLSLLCVTSDCQTICLTVVYGDGGRDGEVVQAELATLGDPATQSKNPLWADRDRARVFSTLRERVWKVPRIVDICGRVLR